MQKLEYSFIVLTDNNFYFYETSREPRLLLQIQKPLGLDSLFGFSNRSDPSFYQALIKVINQVAEEGWELNSTGQGVLVWYFKRLVKS